MARNALTYAGVGVAALVAALGLAAGLTLDWRFVQRVMQLPQDAGEWPDSLYQPVTTIAGSPEPFFPVAASDSERTVDPSALQAAADWAGQHNSVALIVLHRGKVQLERYWEDVREDTLYSGRAMTRTLVALALGDSIASGRIQLDDPASKFLPEWRNGPRARISIDQLLHATSGLEEVPLGAVQGTASATLATRWAAVAERYTDKNWQLAFGSDFEKAALSFDSGYAPGSRFSFANSNPQILGVILERVAHMDYAQLIQERIWAPLGAGVAEFYMDREGGMPAVYCCFRATARDWLRVGSLLVTDGKHRGRQVLPPGWVAKVASTSEANPQYGMQIWSGNPPIAKGHAPSVSGLAEPAPYLAEDVMLIEGGGGRSVWAVPSRDLVVVRLGRASAGWERTTIPNMILQGILPAAEPK